MSIFNRDRVQRLLDSMDVRADAGETAAFTRQLQHIEEELYKIEYPANRARDFVPVDSSVPNWAESFVWRTWDWAGMAKLITRYSDDLPAADVIAAETIQKIHSIGNSFSYSVQDLRVAAKMAINLDMERAELARQAQENKIEDLATFGDVASGLPGFLNNPNVPVLSAPGTLNGDWLNPATTPKEVLADMHTIANSIPILTKNTSKPDTMILPFEHFNYVSVTQLTEYADTTVLEAFLKQSPYIRNVDQWYFLDTADAAGTGPRAVAYERNPKTVRLVLPQPFEMLPPQARNLMFQIPCHSRIGGVSWRRPLAAAYADGI